MNIRNISTEVRIVNYGSTVCFDGQDDIVIEKRVDGQWSRERSFNSLSSDTAYTDSSEYAHWLAAQMRRVVSAA